METTRVKPPYGLAHVIPDDAVAAWGARAIVTQDGRVDIPWDRGGADGPESERHRLLAHLSAVLPGRDLLALVRDLLRAGVMQTRAEEDFVLHMDDAIVIHANTNASVGYCYVTAWLQPNAYTLDWREHEPTLGSDAVGGDVQASDSWSARAVWKGAGDRWRMRTAYAYAVGVKPGGDLVSEPSDTCETDHYEIQLLVSDVVCTDADDPGSTEVWADVTYPGLPARYQGPTRWASLAEAEVEGRHVVTAWLNAQPLALTRE